MRPKINIKNAITPPYVMKRFKFFFSDAVTETTQNAAVSYTFRLNDMFDPSGAGGSRQPGGFDQWVGVFYENYCVVGARWHIRVKRRLISPQTNPYFDLWVMTNLTDDSSENPDFYSVKEGRLKYGKAKLRTPPLTADGS